MNEGQGAKEVDGSKKRENGGGGGGGGRGEREGK